MVKHFAFKWKRHFSILTGLLFGAILPPALYAQNFGGTPYSVDWKQVRNQQVTVIFEKGQDSLARIVSAQATLIKERYGFGQRRNYKPVSLILQNRGLASNGYVALAPWRSEFFTTPPQNPFELGSMSWIDNLALHEIRHVQQYEAFNTGLSALAGTLFGENGRLLLNDMAVPDWFFEGDAIVMETQLSEQGRGRLPAFVNEWRIFEQGGRKLNYQQLRNGAYNYYVPNHYTLGYILNAYSHQKFGKGELPEIASDAAAYKNLVYPFQSAFRKKTSIRFSKFVDEALQAYRNLQVRRNDSSTSWITSTVNNDVVHYIYPQPNEKNKIIVALKKSRRNSPEFIALDSSGRESTIGKAAIMLDDYFTLSNDQIVYAGYQPDTRWTNEEKNEILIQDFKTGKIHYTGIKGRYLSPALDQSGKWFVAVESLTNGSCRLVILNRNGEIQYSLKGSPGFYYSHPRFLPGGNRILVAVRKPDGQMGWLQWDFDSDMSVWLLQPVQANLGFPVLSEHRIFFTGSDGDLNAVFEMDSVSGHVQKVGYHENGISQGFVIQDRVVASIFTAGGNRLAKLPVEARPGTPSLEIKPLFLEKPADAFIGSKTVDDVAMPSKPYSKFKRPFNFHSVVPYWQDPEFVLNIQGANVLNTFLTNLSGSYNSNERSFGIGGDIIYGGSYLQPYLTAQYRFERPYVKDSITYHFNELEYGAGLRLPLNFTSGRWFRHLTLQSGIHNSRLFWGSAGKDVFQNRNFTMLHLRGQFAAQTQKGMQEIYPDWYIGLLADYRGGIGESEGRRSVVNLQAFAPGLAKTHSLGLQIAWQSRDTLARYSFTDLFPFSRGYSALNYPVMLRYSGNYHFPLFSINQGFANLAFVHRVRMNLFFDWTKGRSLRQQKDFLYRSGGAEVFLDGKVWNQLPLSLGLRYTRLFDGGKTAQLFEFILPLNLY